MKLKMQPSDLLKEISSINTFLKHTGKLNFPTFSLGPPSGSTKMSLHSTHDFRHFGEIFRLIGGTQAEI